MSFLSDVMSGRQQEYQDFVGRYDQGPPYEGISNEEAFGRHDEMASNISSEEYGDSARQALENLSPDERQQFGAQLSERAREQGLDVPGLDQAREGDPGMLGQLMAQLHGQAGPAAIGQLLGGGGRESGLGGMLGGAAGKAAVAGIAAMAARRFLG